MEVETGMDYDEERLKEGEGREEEVHHRKERWWVSGVDGGRRGHLIVFCIMFCSPDFSSYAVPLGGCVKAEEAGEGSPERGEARLRKRVYVLNTGVVTEEQGAEEEGEQLKAIGTKGLVAGAPDTSN
ncbi:hypothetical protein NDU88_008621 [Pleurodeles waltl]|uniref:Uncharacterized protein n=1 Tax=Pleurodeles waltl TaxID=8319 RepID=A0AAV7QTA7_PLEWA|nr:hypothetical protein NDU88_008621 [Pleurodeles waltl]